MIDIKSIQETAEREILEERSKKAKDKVKAQLKKIDDAEQIVVNLKRELDALYADIGAGIN